MATPGTAAMLSTTPRGMYVFVDQGTVYKDRAFVCITDRGTDVVGTSGVTITTGGWINTSRLGYIRFQPSGVDSAVAVILPDAPDVAIA